MPSSLIPGLNIPPRRDVRVALETLAREDHKRAKDAQEGYERYYKPQPWRWLVALRQWWTALKQWEPFRMTVIVLGCITIIAMGFACLWLWMAL